MYNRSVLNIFAIVLLSLILNVTLAQQINYSGIYTDSVNNLNLELFQEADGFAFGSLTGPDGNLDIDGFVEADGLLYAEIYSDTFDFAAIAELTQTALNLVIFEYDLTGNLNENSGQLFIFTKTGQTTTQPPVPTEAKIQNPVQTPAQTPTVNPLATPDNSTAISDTQSNPLNAGQAQALVTQLSGETAKMEKQYQGGTRIKSAGAGVSFLVPNDYVAGFLPQTLSFQIASMTQQGSITIQAYSKGNLQQQLQQFSHGFEAQGIQFTPQSAPQLLADTLTVSYSYALQGQQGFMTVLAKQSSAGNVLILMPTGPMSEKTRLEALAQDVMASAEFAVPDATLNAQLQQQLSGQAFRKIKSSSSNADVVTGIGSSSSTNLTFDLCSSGQYNYQFSSDFVVSGPGTSVISDSGESDQGTWEAGYTLLHPTVILNSIQGGISYIEVMLFGGKTYINQSEVFLVPSENCN